MGSVGTPVLRRMIEVTTVDAPADELLASVGLASTSSREPWTGQSVDAETYYALVERLAPPTDPEFPVRYGDALRPEDLGALGLAMKTAPTVGDALGRLVRYVLVLSDTLDYELRDIDGGRAMVLLGRAPHTTAHERGAAIANECALCAVASITSRVAAAPVRPRAVSFRHDDVDGRGDALARHFGCRVQHGAAIDSIDLGGDSLRRPTALGDAGLSAYLLAQLDELHRNRSARSPLDAVRAAIADALPDGVPSKSRIARRLGTSERTLHRRLADAGTTFQDLAVEVRRDAATALLDGSHAIAEVAFLTGFADQSSFTRAFRRWTGTTPAAYRSAAGR